MLIVVTLVENLNLSNGSNSIELSDSESVTTANNSINNNWEGIIIHYGKRITIKDKRDGIHLSLSDYNTIERNVVSNNKRVGIYLYASSKNKILKNFIFKNGGYDNSLYYNNSAKDEFNPSYKQAYDTTNNHWLGNYWRDWVNKNVPYPIYLAGNVKVLYCSLKTTIPAPPQ